MPLRQGRNRRSQPEPESEAESPGSSPERPTQRRRTSTEDVEYDIHDNELNAATQDANSTRATLVKKMVRYALACEYQRKPICRADISDKVLGTGAGRKFKEIFAAANVELKSVFGMEMVELPGREKVTVQQKRAAQKSQTGKGSSAVSYVLVSVLPAEFRDPGILGPPAAPTSAEEGKYTSFYTLLIALISLSGNALPDAKMERYLRRLNILDNVPFGAVGAGGPSKTEAVLKRMEKEGYIVKIKEASGTGEDDIYWTVGPRGKVEVGKDGVEGVVKSVYGDLDGEEEEELERRIGRSLGVGEEEPVPREVAQQQNGDGKKKRGRKRKDEVEERGEGEGSSGSSDED